MAVISAERSLDIMGAGYAVPRPAGHVYHNHNHGRGEERPDRRKARGIGV